jgi:hypothetical protein
MLWVLVNLTAVTFMANFWLPSMCIWRWRKNVRMDAWTHALFPWTSVAKDWFILNSGLERGDGEVWLLGRFKRDDSRQEAGFQPYSSYYPLRFSVWNMRDQSQHIAPRAAFRDTPWMWHCRDRSGFHLYACFPASFVGNLSVMSSEE